MLKYRIQRHWPKAEIEPVEVIKETSQSVWLKPNASYKNAKANRAAKKSDYCEYYDTWALAHAALLDLVTRRLVQARNALSSAQGLEGNVRGMKEPQEAAIRTESAMRTAA